MARIRSIKPETFKDELLGSLPRDIRLLFIGLWTLADDEGRFRAGPAYVRAEVFPYDDLTVSVVSDWLGVLSKADRIQLYESDGQKYGLVTNFLKHQKIDHPGAPRHPAPPKTTRSKSGKVVGKSSRGTPVVLASPSERLAPDQIGSDLLTTGSKPEPLTRATIPGTARASQPPSPFAVVVRVWEDLMGTLPDEAVKEAVRDWLKLGHSAARLAEGLAVARKAFGKPGGPDSVFGGWKAVVRGTPVGGEMRWGGTAERQKPVPHSASAEKLLSGLGLGRKVTETAAESTAAIHGTIVRTP